MKWCIDVVWSIRIDERKATSVYYKRMRRALYSACQKSAICTITTTY
jgi:hypothetical protein